MRRDVPPSAALSSPHAAAVTKPKQSLARHGCYAATTGLHHDLLAAWTRLRGGRRVIACMSVDKSEV